MQTFLESFWDIYFDELRGNRDIEGYDRVMNLSPIYPNIFYYLGFEHR